MDDQQQMLQETSALAQALSDIFRAKKMNVANLGNMVSQLHIHVIARLESDPAWPGPVWGKVPAMPYSADELASVKERLDALLTGEVAFTPASTYCADSQSALPSKHTLLDLSELVDSGIILAFRP